MRKFLVWVPVAVGLTLGVSCSGKKQEATGEGGASGRVVAKTPQPEACDLMPLAEAQAVYGPTMTVVPRRTGTETGPGAVVSTCLYSTDDTPIKAVTILLRTSLVGERTLSATWIALSRRTRKCWETSSGMKG